MLLSLLSSSESSPGVRLVVWRRVRAAVVEGLDRFVPEPDLGLGVVRVGFAAVVQAVRPDTLPLRCAAVHTVPPDPQLRALAVPAIRFSFTSVGVDLEEEAPPACPS